MSLAWLHGITVFTATLLVLAGAGGSHSVDGPSGAYDESARLRQAAMHGVVIVKYRQSDAAGKRVAGPLFQRLGVTEVYPLFAENPLLERRVDAAKSKSVQRKLADLQRIHEVHFAEPVPPHIAAAWIAQDPSVEYAEPRYRYPLDGAVTEAHLANGTLRRRQEPNDPQFGGMSHLDHVQFTEAWDLVKAGDGTVLLAIVDAGTEWRHDDLVDNVWLNPGELDNGVDDDKNGHVDDLRGWNFASDTNDPTGLNGTPSNGRHGTIVAGVAAAVTDNLTGIAGASWNGRFIPINAACPTTDNAVCFGYDGILYAAMMGAEVINASWGGPDSFLGREIIDTVVEMGSLVVVSAGNNGGVSGTGGNLDAKAGYPASYNGVLVVGATGKNNDTKASFSNYGLSVDVFAPGVSIESTAPGNTYTSQASGTSFSTPLVSALAALLKTHKPGWSMKQIREQIRVTSENIDASNPSELEGLLGHGRMNALRALTDESLPSVRIRGIQIEDSGRDGAIQNGDIVDVSIEVTNYLAHATSVSLSLSAIDSTVIVLDGTHQIGLLEKGAIARARFTFQMSDDAPNDYLTGFVLRTNAVGYTDAEFFALTANRATHATGLIEMSITDEGNIGWSDFQETSAGKGFRFFGVDWLFEGGLMLATGPTRISDSIRNTGTLEQDSDFAREDDSFFGVMDAPLVSQIGVAKLNDSAAGNPIGVKIHQESYAGVTESTNDFIVLRYLVSHQDPRSPISFDNLYVGLFTDWDLTNGGDFARYDASRRLGMVQSSASNPLVVLGAKLLTTGAGISYRSIDNEEIYDIRSGGNGFTNEEKWAFLSEGVQVQSVDNQDVSTLLAAGPYRLNPGEEVEVAFALIASTGLESMYEYADQAQTYWNQTLRLLAPSSVATEPVAGDLPSFTSEAPFPNPMTETVSLAFQLNQPGSVEITIYDILGREVRHLSNKTAAPGRHIVQWDGRNQEGVRVSNGMYLCAMVAQTPGGAFEATQRLVVVR